MLGRPGRDPGRGEERPTMAIIGAAALIAVGIVVAALVYGRAHNSPRSALAIPAAAEIAVIDPEQLERRTELARREQALAKRESELERGREQYAQSRQEHARDLERISGL